MSGYIFSGAPSGLDLDGIRRWSEEEYRKIARASEAWESFLQTGTGAQYRQVSDRLRDFYLAKDFGAKGDGVTDDSAALDAVFTAAAANGKSVGLTSGVYGTSRTWNVAYDYMHVVALDGDVQIKRLSGTATPVVSMDGQAAARGYVYDQTFGGAHRIYLQGNGIASQGMYVRKAHNSNIRINSRNATLRPIEADTCVESDFEVQASGNDLTFTTVSVNGCLFNEQAGCRYLFKVEGAGGSDYGVTFTGGQCCHITGTVEGCPSGGIRLNNTSKNHTLYKLDSELNYTAYDFNIAGSNHTLIGCIGGLTTSGSIFGGTNFSILGCEFENTTVLLECVPIVMIGNTFVGTFTDAALKSIRLGNVGTGASDKIGLHFIDAIPIVQLPTAVGRQGGRAIITDSSVNTFNSVLIGGGAFTVPVFSDGANWRIG